MKNWKSREVLLNNSEPQPVDDADVTLPAQAAALKLIQPADSSCVSETRIGGMDTAPKTTTTTTPLSLAAQNCRRSDSVNLEALLKQRTVWYRNWTNAGIALCVIYNLCIVFLLLMGFFHFTKS